MRYIFTYLGIALFCLLLDQATKYLVWERVKFSVDLLPFLSFTKTTNSGFTFGLFQQEEGFIKAVAFIGIPTLFMLLLLGVLFRIRDPLKGVALALILGGGIGNLLDRFLLGEVRDFIDFHIGQWHYPTFNVADICITSGALLLLFGYLRERGNLKGFENQVEDTQEVENDNR